MSGMFKRAARFLGRVAMKKMDVRLARIEENQRTIMRLLQKNMLDAGDLDTIIERGPLDPDSGLLCLDGLIEATLIIARSYKDELKRASWIVADIKDPDDV